MVINFYDIAYGFGVGISAPVWVVRSKTRTKVLNAFAQRMGHLQLPRQHAGPTVLIHAVSVGELNASRQLIDALKQHDPSMHLVVSTTTETGYARARELYAMRDDITLIRYPLDFTAAVRRVLDTLKPVLVILMELELWPNFVGQCFVRGIKVVVANGRITEKSFKGYRVGSWLTRRMFGRLAAVCVQEPIYAERFIALGADPGRTNVTGTMKFDTAPQSSCIDGAQALADDLMLRKPLWVCGSTGPGEEDIILQTYQLLLKDVPDLQLAIIPRKPERFDEVAALIEAKGYACRRRSQVRTINAESDNNVSDVASDIISEPVILGDTMGELRKFYAMADVVLVGRTLLDLGEKQHGSDMIEPTALGKPTVVGPFTGNFTDVMHALRNGRAIIEIKDPDELCEAVYQLLTNPNDIGSRAIHVVQTQRGATDRTLKCVLQLLSQ
jgi:3-deoxy-D-manno-octulosonic-acid transferase